MNVLLIPFGKEAKGLNISTHMSTHMTSVNISLTEEAYGYLKILKGKEKSFSDVVLELKAEKKEKGRAKDLLKFAGVLKDSDWDSIEERMRVFRKEVEERLR